MSFASEAKKRITSTLQEWKLVLMRVSRPDRHEFLQALKVVGLGVVLVGGLAYIIHLAAVLLLGVG